MTRTNERASLLLTLAPDKRIDLACMTPEPDRDGMEEDISGNNAKSIATRVRERAG